jgi:S-adenosylmethionine:diacylglycerol 3-amino-3-carboxypropyl transferase
MENPPFRSPISYSVQNEDYRTELAVLQRLSHAPPYRVLLVASSGENALSLLVNETVASVDAIDLNPAQLHLCELRRTALEHLTRDEQLRLLGADPAAVGSTGASERLALYAAIRTALPDAAQAFWDTRRDLDLAFGVQHVGRNDVCMHDIQAGVQTAGFAPLQRPLQDHELDAWKRVYTSLMTADYILDLFGLPSAALAAQIASIAGYLGACHFRALQQPHPERNPFLTTVFANRYAVAAGEEGLPDYLQQQGQEVLRRRDLRACLRFHQGNLVEQLPVLSQAYGSFDLISISNIADWMSEEQFGATVQRVRIYLTLGGALLARTATGRSMIREVTAAYLASDPGFNQELEPVERGPWFRTIAVGFHG